MRQCRFEVFDESRQLRYFDADGKLAGSRSLSENEIDQLVHEVETAYGKASPDLAKLGQQLHDWLDGPSQRWLENARAGPGGMSVHVDVAGRLG